MSQLPDYDAVYRGQPVTREPVAPEGGRVPWNIGEPQPAIAALITAGQVHSPVLDAGCGVGTTAIELAVKGYQVLGVDASPTAIAQARRHAAQRGVESMVEFVVADITGFTGHDGRFATVIDSTLFHSLPVGRRPDYLRAIARAARPDAVLHVLVFDRAASVGPGADSGSGPNAVTEPELRAAVSPYWTVEAITPAAIHAWTPQAFTADIDRDDQGRARFPAFLARAHLRS